MGGGDDVVLFDKPDEARAEHGVGGGEKGGAERFGRGEGFVDFMS